jgi:hypothetical protein
MDSKDQQLAQPPGQYGQVISKRIADHRHQDGGRHQRFAVVRRDDRRRSGATNMILKASA